MGVGVTAYVGLGSNLGDRLAMLQNAVDLLARHERIKVLGTSRVYETDPVGGPPQDPFLNAVAELETDLDPAGLLQACQQVESVLGRVRDVPWGPRTIDLDVLLFDALTVDEPNLQIPHPRLHERAFVLVPLSELRADLVLPNGMRVADLRPGAESADDAATVRPYAPPLRTRHR